MRRDIELEVEKKWYGWRITTISQGPGMGVGPGPFALTRTGIERKAARLVKSRTHEPEGFKLRYDSRGRPLPPYPPAPPPPPPPHPKGQR